MRRRDKLRRMLSNVLLGITVGLLAYYGLTTVLGWLAQDTLRDTVSDVPTLTEPDPAVALESSPTPVEPDFSAWESEDLAYWQDLPEGGVFGRIVIPAIGVDAMVVNSTTAAALRQGPGWMDWTSLPGPSGTCGIAGHRTTFGAPFRRVDELSPGDTIDLYSAFRRYRYSVLRTLVVLPSQTEVLHPEEQPSLVLSACHPPYSARYRIVIQAVLVEVQRVQATLERDSE